MRPFAVDRVQPSYVQVAAQLRALILSRQVLPGERLPPEAELAAQFGVSRPTTREALRLLAAERLIETRRGAGGGAFVTCPDPSDIERALSTGVNLVLGTEHLSIDEVLEVWLLTQSPAAALAARRRTDDQARALLALAQPVPAGTTEAEATVRAIDFHNLVIEACGNRLLQVYARPVNAVGAAALAETDHAHAFVLEAFERHARIADAIAAGDEHRAQAEMTADLAAAARHRSEHLRAGTPAST